MTGRRSLPLHQALWIGLLGGYAEVAVLAWRRLVDGKLVFVVTHYWWLSPLVTSLFVAAASVVAVRLIPLRFSASRERVGYLAASLIAILGVLLLFTALADVAALLLALGLGVQASAWLVRHAPAFDRVVRRTLALGLLLPLTAGTGLMVLPRVRGWPSEAGGTAGLPNVLLLVLDTVRAMELGLYGSSPSISPVLDGFAADGVVYDQAYAPSSWTAPSHASLFTGRPASQLSIDWERPLDRRYPTLAEALRRHGYATFGVAANRFYTSRETGLARGFEHYEDSHLTPARILLLPRVSKRVVNAVRRQIGAPETLDPGRVTAGEINRRVLSRIERVHNRPFFGFVNYFDAHAPYRAAEPHWTRQVGNPATQPPDIQAVRSPAEAALQRQAYRAAIAGLDQSVGDLIHGLLVRGKLDNTIVVITADHGEEFLEHGFIGHGSSLYAQSVRVPLIVVGLGRVPAGRRVLEPVSLDRLPATILDLIGRPNEFPGVSLADLWNGRQPVPIAVRAHLYVSRDPERDPLTGGPIASIQAGSLRFIYRYRDSVGQLYDHRSDPLETHNLAGRPEAARLMRALLDSLGMPELTPRSGVP